MGATNTLGRWEQSADQWGPIVFRLAPLLAAYWISQLNFLFGKFTAPGNVASVLGQMGAPNPIWFIYVLGIIELAFIITALVGFWARIPAVVLIIELLFAWYYGGPNPQLMVLLLSAYFVAVYGTGMWSISNPSWEEIYDRVAG